MSTTATPSLQDVLKQLETLTLTVQHMVAEQEGTPEKKVFSALERKDWQVLNTLIHAGFSGAVLNNKGETMAMAAVRAGDVYFANVMLAHGKPKVDVNARNPAGETALHIALRTGAFNVARRLLQEEALDPNVKDTNGMTPLMALAESKYNGRSTAPVVTDDEILRLLVEKGADHAMTNNAGKTARDIASAGKLYLIQGLDKAAEGAVAKGWKSRQPAGKKPDHAFTIPKGSVKDAFNTAVPAAAQALQNYVLENPKKKDLIEADKVLAALAMETISESNRKSLYPVDLEEYIADDYLQPENRELFNVIKGQSKYGIGVVALRVLGSDDKPEDLLVIEDQMRRKMYVLGNDAIDATLQTKMLENGVTYGAKSNAWTADAIDDFVRDAFRFRADQRLTDGTSTGLDTLYKGIAAICEMSHGTGKETLGQLLVDQRSTCAVFTSIVKPPEPKPVKAAAAKAPGGKA
ncbi:MAG: ankyrin repeat domain-containing protein [Alphaproteobacteria bacterium]